MTIEKPTIRAKNTARKRVASLLEASQSDDYSTQLKAARDKVAGEIDQTVSKRDLAALVRQYMLIIAELDRQPIAQRSKRDELRDKRAERQRKARLAGLQPPAPADEPAVTESEQGQ